MILVACLTAPGGMSKPRASGDDPGEGDSFLVEEE